MSTDDVAKLRDEVNALREALAQKEEALLAADADGAINSITGGASALVDEQELSRLLEEERKEHTNTALNAIISRMRASEQCKVAVNDAYISAQMRLVTVFETHAKRIHDIYDARVTPHRMLSQELQQPLRNLMEGRCVQVLAVALDSVISQFRGRNRFGSEYSSFDFKTGRALEIDAGHGDFLSFVEKLRDQRKREEEATRVRIRKELDAQMEAKRKSDKMQERADLALTRVLPVMSQLSLEQAMKALEICKDDADDTINWVLGLTEDMIEKRLTVVEPQAAAVPSAAPVDLSANAAAAASTPVEDPGFSDEVSVPFTRQVSGNDSSDGFTFLRIKRISDEGIVELKQVTDRNRIPLDPDKPRTIKLPLEALINVAEFAVLSTHATVALEMDVANRPLVITYQLFDDEAFSPISIRPAVKLAEYKIEWEPRSRRIESVMHRTDGKVLFRAVKDSGDGLGLNDASTPAELYTEALDENTHNVVHMHVNDTRSDIAIDTINLTGTSQTVEDCLEFQKDAAGRQLTYRIVVKDSAVVAVLFPFGGRVQRCAFKEYKLPRLGSKVSLSGGRLAVLRHVPVGLIIATQPLQEERAGCTFPQQGACNRKHASELTGFVDVEVVMDDGKLCDPVQLQLPVCAMSVASPDQLRQLKNALEEKEQGKERELASLIERLEKGIVARRSGDESAATQLSALSDIRQRIDELKEDADVENLATKRGEAAVKQLAALRQRAARAAKDLRLLALELRSTPKK